MKGNRIERIFACLIGIIFVSVGCASATTHYVNPGDSIQDAVTAADPGDTIEVSSGDYYETVNIDKQLILRGIDTGTGKPVVDAGYSGTAITLSADEVTVDGFKVIKWSNDGSGVHVLSNGNTIMGNTILGPRFEGLSSGNGIIIDGSNNLITGTTVDGVSAAVGMSITGSNNKITENIIMRNFFDGLAIHGSYTTIADNQIVANEILGIRIYSSYNTISGNTVWSFLSGISCESGSNNVITGNTFEVGTNGDHLSLRGGGYNIVTGNTFETQKEWNRVDISSSNNLIHNNYFAAGLQLYDSGNNIWNITKTEGTNIIGGPYLGGNYFGDYAGKDLDGDGLGDTLLPYNSGGNIINGGDWLPLTPTNVLVETSTGTGTAQFSTNSGLFAEINAIDEDSLPQEAKDNKPVGLTLPHGLFSFTITGLTPGQSVTLTITLPSPVPIGSLWWKVKTTDNTWYSLPIGDDDGDSVITITLTDGGLGDNDGVANGVIVDPSGIGIDTIPPEITCPPAVTVNTNPGVCYATGVALGSPAVSDNCDPAPTVTNNAPAQFGRGTTTVIWTATDASGNSATCTQTVTVNDNEAPVITVTVSPNTLWSPNHKYVYVTATVTAKDNCDSSPPVTLVSVTSNEPDDAPGATDGKTVNDIVIVKDYKFNLRAERSETGTGRVYTITYRVTDASGNNALASATVTVPLVKTQLK